MSRFGLEKYSKLTKAGCYQNFLLHELDARGFNDFFKPQTMGAKGRPKKRELKGFKALMDTLKEMEAARVAREFPNDTDRAEAAKKGFRKLSAMEVQANLQVTVGICLSAILDALLLLLTLLLGAFIYYRGDYYYCGVAEE
jgi:hypothetical protein